MTEREIEQLFPRMLAPQPIGELQLQGRIGFDRLPAMNGRHDAFTSLIIHRRVVDDRRCVSDLAVHHHHSKWGRRSFKEDTFDSTREGVLFK